MKYMPGFVLHLLHGEMVMRKCRDLYDSESERNLFRLGLLLPDTVKSQEKYISHFYSVEQRHRILRLPDLDAFMEKYQNDMKNPLVLGYAAHLYLDFAFFSDYFLRYVLFSDENGRPTLDEQAVRSVFLIKDQKTISTEELFSEQYLYGDYTKMNQYLVQKYRIKPPFFPPMETWDNPIDEADPQNLPSVLTSLQKYLSVSNNMDADLSVFSADTLESALETYALELIEWCKLSKIFITS